MSTAKTQTDAETQTDQASCIRCSKAIAQNVRFCPFCAAEQPPLTGGSAKQPNSSAKQPNGSAKQAESGAKHDQERGRARKPGTAPEGIRYAKAPQPDAKAPQPDAKAPKPADVPEEPASLVLRAGEKIWHFEEEETTTKPGQPRPWLVVDEQITHLAHTDRELTADVLLSRVQGLLAQDRVPVQVQLLDTRWQSDAEELRPRLVASLENHRYSDIKMLLGLDYLGNWASIHLALAVEPAPLPVPPSPEKAPDDPPFQHPIGAIICLILGLLGVMGGSAESGNSSYGDPLRALGPVIIGAGVVLGLAGVIAYMVAYSNHSNLCARHKAAWEQEKVRRKQAWEREQYQLAQKHMMDRLSRTFKVDDMRLFSTAMREVYQRVVDDIVSQGAQVARIEGGQGGFFESQGVTQAAAPARKSDAASLEV